MSTPTPRTDACLGDLSELSRNLETELTTALARVAELEQEELEGRAFQRGFDMAATEIHSLTSQLSESQAQFASMTEEYYALIVEHSKTQAQLTSLREANAVLQSQVDNADINLEQVRMTQKGLWRTKVESAESRIKELEAQLTSAREDVLRMDKAEELCSEFDCTSDATDFFLILPKSRDNEHGPKIFNPTLRSAIDAARGHLAETPAGGETGKDAWQDISTAPKDGTLILVSDGVYVHEAKWSYAQWCVADSWKNWWLNVKFWCALPPPPQGKEKNG